MRLGAPAEVRLQIRVGRAQARCDGTFRQACCSFDFTNCVALGSDAMDLFGMICELRTKVYLITNSLLAIFRYRIALSFDLGT